MALGTFHFTNTDLPTQYNLAKHITRLGGRSVNKVTDAQFSEANLQLHPDIEQLEYKHQLARLCQRHSLSIMPPTYYIDRYRYPTVVDQLTQQSNTVWILKPSRLNNGEGIRLLPSLTAVQHHFQSPGHFDGPHVLQHYISQPHLLNGHKYSFRLFVVITNFAGAFLYPEGYFNICRHSYDPVDLDALEKHLTNEHLGLGEDSHALQIPTSRCPNFGTIYRSIKQYTTTIVSVLKNDAPHIFEQYKQEKALSLFGFDFMLDEQLTLWLLEINHGPCFPTHDDHPLQAYLYNAFWPAVIRQFIFSTPNSNHGFEKIL